MSDETPETAPVTPAAEVPVPRQIDPITELYAPPPAQSLPPPPVDPTIAPPPEPTTTLMAAPPAPAPLAPPAPAPVAPPAVEAPAPALPEPAPSVPAGAPVPVPAPVPAPRRTRRVVTGVVFGVVVLIVLAAIGWVIYDRMYSDPTKNAQAGACLADLPTVDVGEDKAVDAARVVDCNDPAAAYVVEGRLDRVSDDQATSATVCQAYPDATFIYRQPSGTTGYVLCLRKLDQ